MNDQRPYFWLGAEGENVTARPTMTVAYILSVVGRYYRIPVEMLLADTRQRAIARPRQIAYFLAFRLTSQSSVMIGRAIGDRDHSTILAGIRNIENLLGRDALVANDVDALLTRLSA